VKIPVQMRKTNFYIPAQIDRAVSMIAARLDRPKGRTLALLLLRLKEIRDIVKDLNGNS